METHYNNPKLAAVRPLGNAVDDTGVEGGLGASSERNLVDGDGRPKADNSGLKLYYTTQLRKHDAGVLSIGTFVGFMTSIYNIIPKIYSIYLIHKSQVWIPTGDILFHHFTIELCPKAIALRAAQRKHFPDREYRFLPL